MNLLKAILTKLAKPNKTTAAIAVCLFGASVGAMVFMVLAYPQSVWTYVLNLFAVVLLGYVIYLIVLLCKFLKPKLLTRAQRNSFSRKFVSSYDFRTVIYAAGRFIINVGYALFNGIYGFIFLNSWYIALFVYYMVLVIARGLMVERSRKVSKGGFTERERLGEKLKIYRAAGILLLVFTFALNVIMTLMLIDPSNGFSYAGMLIFAAAAFTFYKVTMAIINLVKAKGSADPVVHAIRNLNFSEALVSLLSLQTAMLAHFRNEGGSGRSVIIFGMCICAFTTVLGILMIIKAQRRLKRLRAEPEGSVEREAAIESETGTEQETE